MRNKAITSVFVSRRSMSELGQTATCQRDIAMSALPPIPKARGGNQSLSACHADGKARRVLHYPGPISPAAAFRGAGDNGVDHGGVEGAVNHQRFGDGEHRRAMLDDQRLRFFCTKSKIGIDRGFGGADQAGQRFRLTNVAVRRPWRAFGMQQQFPGRSGH
jgi:hypothetical protein